jgi:hypothetical protein
MDREIFAKYLCLVVFNVASRIEKCNWPTLANGAQLFHCWITIKLCNVTSPEFLPALGTMVEPFAQFGAWRDIPEPNYFSQRLFADPAGPNTVYQNALSVSTRSLLIDSLDLQFCHHCAWGDPQKCFVRMIVQALTVNISPSGFLILAAAGTVASSAGWPTARIISGFSEDGRFSNAFRNFIGLGVWVSVERPA